MLISGLQKTQFWKLSLFLNCFGIDVKVNIFLASWFIVRVFCSLGYLLCSVVKNFVGNLLVYKFYLNKKILISFHFCLFADGNFSDYESVLQGGHVEK